jgi:hypothetical protein
MTNPSEVVADLRIAAEDARRFSAALFDRGYVRREGVRPFSELLERAADTIDRLTSTGEAVAYRTDIFENLPNGKLTRLILDASEVKDPDPDWKPLFYSSPREGPVEVPDGMVLVPRVATAEMLDAHYEAHAQADTVFADAQTVWQAMLAALPHNQGETKP